MAFRITRQATACLAATLIGATTAAAQSSNESTSNQEKNDDAIAVAADDQIRLDTISIMATRNPIEAFDYPGMVSVVGREHLLTHQASTPDDVLRFVPNLEFVGGPRRTGESPTIRGFDGADVIITIDGARQNLETGHDGRFLIDPSLLSAVEVLRGPASSLYGSGGTGGLIAFRTVRAEDLLAPGESGGVSLAGGYQTVNREPFGIFTAYGRPSDGVDLVGSVTKRDSGSVELGDGSKLDQTDDDILSALAKAGFAIADHHHVEASFQRFANVAEEPNNGQGAGGSDIVEKDMTADNWRLAYNFNDPDDPYLNLDALVYYTAFTNDETRLDGSGTGPAGEGLVRDVDTIGFRIDNRSRAMLSDASGVTFTYGAEAYEDNQDGSDSTGERDGVPDARAAFAGAFMQAEILLAGPFGALPGELLIIPGLRYDHYISSSAIAADNEDQELSPRLGASYMPTEWSVLFASYAYAFRAPTFNEAYLDGVHFEIPIGPGITNRFVENPDLRPQRTETFEFGGGLDFSDVAVKGDRVQLKASHFRTKGRDFIDLEVDQPTPFVDCNPFILGNCDGTTRAVNVANAELDGFEIEAFYETSRVDVAFGLSTLNGRNVDTNQHLGSLTPTQVTVDFAYKLIEWDSLIGWRVLGAQRFNETDDSSEERDGYVVQDLYASWIPQTEPLAGLRIDLGVDNVFDKAYERVFTDSLEPGRNFKIRIGYALNF